LIRRYCRVAQLDGETRRRVEGFPELAGFRRRVMTIDARFQPLLMEHAFPGIDPEEWWLRGIVRRAGGRLAQDWKRSFGFDVEVVRQPRVT